jgi:hypothetical protein
VEVEGHCRSLGGFRGGCQAVAGEGRHAQERWLDLKEVIYQALEEFFQRRGYTDERA